MQSKDLRIGNLVMNEVQKIELKVLALNYGKCFVENEAGDKAEVSTDLLNGIPIDNLDLYVVQFNLRKIEFNNYELDLNEDTYLGLIIDEYGECHVQIEQHSECIYLESIYYIHELQNLYFALTGKELELKHESKP